MASERHEAIGLRGEACIILLKITAVPSGGSIPTYSLASGERLKPTETAGEFSTLDGTRTFKLRRPSSSTA